MSAPAAAEATWTRIGEALEGIEHRTSTSSDGMACIHIGRDVVHDALGRLKTDAHFASVTLVTAVDLHPVEPRFEVQFQLWSLKSGDRVRVKVRVPGDDPTCPSCVDLWPGASFFERECFDMFGVVFEGHPDLKRLLMPEGYGHHPLRKEFPHQGIEPDRLYRKWDEERRSQWKDGQ
ncbi:MAG: NADH-quinone oxidoreductase subunit C [Planctomycetota bacterium]